MKGRRLTRKRSIECAWHCCALSVLLVGVIVPSPLRTPTEPHAADRDKAALPHRLFGAVADVLVRVTGGAVCSGTPLADTRYVVTAAHCVLDRDGSPGRRSVLRGNARFDAVAVLVDIAYGDHPSERLDAAVIVLDRPVPGPAARLGSTLPPHGIVTLAGYQPLNSDGALLRGSNPHNRPLPDDASGTVIEIRSAPVGCDAATADLRESSESLSVPCGLIPGASGGGLFADAPEGMTLLGIVSTVSSDLTANGVVPLTSLHHLLANAHTYFHDFSDHTDAGYHGTARRS